jgi:hypothetical protein
MALHLILGYEQPGSGSPVETLYCGRNADEARAKRDGYQGHRTTWLRNPEGVTKIAAGVAAAKDAALSAGEIARIAARPEVPISTEAQLDLAQRELRRLKRQLEQGTEPQPIAQIVAAVVDELPLIGDSLPLSAAEADASAVEGDEADASAVEGDEGSVDAAEGDLEPGTTLGDPEADARRAAALAAAEAAEQLENAPPAKGKKGK